MSIIENYPLNFWQRRQAALLYHFSSMEFLDEIIRRVRALTAFTDYTLPFTARVEREKVMRALGWDEAHCAASWFRNGDSRLVNCLKGLLDQKKMRPKESYDIANVRGALTGMSHLLPYWPPPEEQEPTSELIRNARAVAANLDTTINHTWTDKGMLWAWEQHKDVFSEMPGFRIRSDVQGESGKRRPRTGVYLPQDDPCGTLQFAWTGDSGGMLDLSETLSDLAREYMILVGRDRLWRAPTEVARVPNRMEPTDKYFDDWCRRIKKMKFPDMISSRNDRAYVKQACRWFFVEQVPAL